MAETVVHDLEAIEIEVEHREVASADAAPAPGASVEAWATVARIDAADDVRRAVGAHTIAVPAGLSSYATTLALDATRSVRVQGSLDRSSGVLKWTFDTIDPATGLPPSDPTLGFLPPDTDGAKGQGFVSFTVTPVAGLADGTAISNQASIVFDSNPAIATPTWPTTTPG